MYTLDEPSFLIERLVHYSRFYDVGWRAHTGGHQAGHETCHDVHQVVVVEIRVPQDEPLGNIVGGQIPQIDQSRTLHVRYST